jgi:hypothetical protein
MPQGKIASKLIKVMAACHYVQKLGENAFHKYKYAMAADVLEKVNNALVENGLAAVVVPELVEFKDVTTKRGDVERLATVKTTITLLDSESGETLSLIGLGSGQDAGDKAVMKAQTASIKYAWMLSLQISTGDDPEADEGVDEQTTGKKLGNETRNSGAATQKVQSSTQAQAPAATVQNSGSSTKPLSGAQIKRFYGIVNSSGATPDIAKIIIENKLAGNCIDLTTGKTDWKRVFKADYDILCNLFASGQWKQYFEDLMGSDARSVDEAS